MEEVWKDIEGYEGKYKASNMGRIKLLNIIPSIINHLDGYKTNNNLSNLELKTSEENYTEQRD